MRSRLHILFDLGVGVLGCADTLRFFELERQATTPAVSNELHGVPELATFGPAGFRKPYVEGSFFYEQVKGSRSICKCMANGDIASPMFRHVGYY